MRVPPSVTKSTTPVTAPVLPAGPAVKGAVDAAPLPILTPPPLQKATPPAGGAIKGNALDVRIKGGCGPIAPTEPTTPALRPEVQQMVTDGKKRFATAGYTGLAAYIAQQELIGQTSRMHSGARQLHDLDVSLNKAVHGGEPAVVARIAEIDTLFMTALMTPEQSALLTEEHVALKGLREAFAPLTARRDDIERVELAGNLGPTLALTYTVEKTVLNGLIDGAARLGATVADAQNSLNAGTLDAAGEREAALVVSVGTAAQGGTAGIEARLAAIAHTRMVARLTPEGQETLNIEEKVLASLARELAAV